MCLSFLFCLLQVFQFLYQADVTVTVQFSEAVGARFFRLTVEEFVNAPAVTIELYGTVDRE